jgi:hypothetical protein
VTDAAFELLASLVIEDGRRWYEAAVDVQREDALAVLALDSPTPYSFETRARGYSKTDDLGGIAIAVMLTQLPPGSRLYGCAADRDQGRLLIDSIQGFVSRTPELAGALVVDSFKVTAPRGGSTLEVLAADAPSAYGLRPAFVVIDELSVWGETSGPRRLFEAVTSALTKVPGARCVVITTAGDPSHWSFKELEHARRDPLWRTNEVPGPPPWTPPERLDEQRRRLVPSMYARLFENRWCESEDRLTSREDVLSCVGHSGDLDYDRRYRYATALDIGLVHDRTAAVVTHGERRQGRLVVVVDRLELWAGTPRRPVDLSIVEEWVAAACHDFRCRLIFDPYQAQHLAQRLRDRRISAEQFTFSQANVGRLALTMYNLLRDNALDLPDNDALVDELAAVRLREVSPGSYRIDHDANRHDDQAIALAMASAHIIERTRRPVPVSSGFRLRGSIREDPPPPTLDDLRRGIGPRSPLPLRGSMSR